MKTVLFSLLCLFICCEAISQQSPSDLAGFIRQRGDSLYKSAKLPGLFVGVLNKGKRHYFDFGYAVPDKKLPFDAATVFEAGSITKTFTAFIVESVLEEKGIADTASIVSYLPDSVRGNKALQSITFLSLLNHTSGLPRLPANMNPSNPMAPYDDYTTANLFSYLKTAKPKPDGKSSYSNLGMGLAGVLAQQLTGKDFNTLLRNYVFTPFGMGDVTGGRKATGIYAYFTSLQPAEYWNMASLAPAGSVQCTADEMLTYLQYMISPKDPKAKAIIDKLLQPTTSLSPTVRIGRGWHTLEWEDKPVVYWHNGGTYGFSTFAAFVKETGQAIIVVVNRYNNNSVSDGFGVAIMRKLLAN